MAYQEVYEDDEEQKQGAPNEQQLTSSENVVDAGSSNTSSNVTGSSTQPAKSNSSSGWTNLSRYVDANQGQAAKMADTVTSGLDTTKNDITSKQSAFATDLNNQIGTGTVNYDNSLAADPTKDSKAWVANYSKMTSGYKGPTDVTKDTRYGDLSGSVNKFDQNVNSLNTNEGRAQTAADTFGKLDQNYSRGENTLDSFLLGSGDAGKNLQQYSQTYQQNAAPKAWESLLSGINSNIDTAKKTSEGAKAKAAEALKSQLGNLDAGVLSKQADIARETANNTAKFSQLSNVLKSGTNDQKAEAFKELGIDPNIGFQLQESGVDLSNLISAGSNRKLGDVVDQSAIDALNALSGLAGVSPTYDFSKSGASSASPYVLNQALIDQGKVAYEQALKDRQNQLDAIDDYADLDQTITQENAVAKTTEAPKKSVPGAKGKTVAETLAQSWVGAATDAKNIAVAAKKGDVGKVLSATNKPAETLYKESGMSKGNEELKKLIRRLF